MYLFSKDVLCSEHDIGLPPEQTNRNIAVVLWHYRNAETQYSATREFGTNNCNVPSNER